MESSSPTFRFGPYELRSRTRELYKHGSKLKVRPQPLEILNILLARAGDVVTREEFRQKLWSSETFVDFEHGLNTSVREIRAVLGDSASQPRYIETLLKMGYRFIAPVELIEAQPVSMGSASLESAGELSQPREASARVQGPGQSGEHSRVFRRGVILVTVIGLIVALAVYVNFYRTRARANEPSTRIMVAVLPFENLTGDATQDYFSDGLTEEMIAQLGHLDPEHIGVIARTSVMHYRDSHSPLPQISQELGVQYVLEGSVRRDSDKIRITAQLIQVKNQAPLWSRQYDRELSNLLVLQTEIAQEVGDEIRLSLGEGHKRMTGRRPTPPPTTSYEAYDLYLKGRYFWNKRNGESFRQAAGFFQQAIDKDPNYAAAYAGLADTFALMSSYGDVPQAEFIPKARAAALKALQIDQTLAEAHTSLALIAQNYDWDWQTAEKEYRRAIELDPDYATAHHWYAECLGFQGRFDQAFAENERARRLDPLSLIIATDYGALLYFSRQYDRAIEEFRRVLEMEPNFRRAYIMIYAQVQKRSFADALADIEKFRRVSDSPLPSAIQIYTYARSGDLVRAQGGLEKLERIRRQQHIDPAVMLVAHLGFDDKEESFAWLQKVYDAHSPSLTALKADPIYDPLRDDPRFQNFLHLVRLAQ